MALRQGEEALGALRQSTAGMKLWLSAVVLEELYAGSVGSGVAVIERMERDFSKAQRILVPNAGDWSSAGKVLSQLVQRYGFEQIGRGRLTNDALIAVTAGRAGATLFTANSRDFARLREFCTFEWSELHL